jgi:hypothetical protein
MAKSKKQRKSKKSIKSRKYKGGEYTTNSDIKPSVFSEWGNSLKNSFSGLTNSFKNMKNPFAATQKCSPEQCKAQGYQNVSQNQNLNAYQQPEQPQYQSSGPQSTEPQYSAQLGGKTRRRRRRRRRR